MMQYKLINIKTHKSQKAEFGSLSVFEGDRDIPFEVKRFYYTYDVSKGEVRGYHAHKSLWQVLFCPHGSIKIAMDDGIEIEEIILDEPSKALLMGPGVWHTMQWMKEGSVLCVAASGYYDESDYIRNYAEFIEYVQKYCKPQEPVAV